MKIRIRMRRPLARTRPLYVVVPFGYSSIDPHLSHRLEDRVHRGVSRTRHDFIRPDVMYP